MNTERRVKCPFLIVQGAAVGTGYEVNVEVFLYLNFHVRKKIKASLYYGWIMRLFDWRCNLLPTFTKLDPPFSKRRLSVYRGKPVVSISELVAKRHIHLQGIRKCMQIIYRSIPGNELSFVSGT